MNSVKNFEAFQGKENMELANIRSILRAAQYLQEKFINDETDEWIKDDIAKFSKCPKVNPIIRPTIATKSNRAEKVWDTYSIRINETKATTAAIIAAIIAIFKESFI